MATDYTLLLVCGILRLTEVMVVVMYATSCLLAIECWLHGFLICQSENTTKQKNKWTVESRPKEEILKTERQIRFELSVIKWYYTQIAQGKPNVTVFDSRLPNFPQLLADYNAAIQTAPRPVQRLWQDMYLSGTNPTQKQLAEQWCVTEKYVQILNSRLIRLFSSSNI